MKKKVSGVFKDDFLNYTTFQEIQGVTFSFKKF